MTKLTLRDCEHLVDDESEMLYRQITKHQMDGEKIASHAMGPATSDLGMPSYSLASKVSAQDAYDWHNANANSPSKAVATISVGDAVAAGLVVVDDSDCPPEPGKPKAPGHCYPDFRNESKGTERVKRAVLLRSALGHGQVKVSGDTTLF